MPDTPTLAVLAALLAGACDSDGSAIASDDTRIGPVAGTTFLRWTGQELALATDRRLDLLNPAGALVASEALPDRRAVGFERQDETFGLFADDSIDIVFERFNADGISLGPPVTLADSSLEVDVEWTGSEYALARNQPAYEISRFDVEGQPVAAPIALEGIDPVPLARRNSLLWNGSGYYVVWSLDDSVWFLELSPEGIPLAEPVMALEGATDPEVLWTGQDIAVVAETLGGEPVFVRIDGAGLLVGEPVLLEGFDCCAADTFRETDSGFVVAGLGDPPVVAQLDGGGNVIELIEVGAGVDPVVESLAWTGERLAVIYSAQEPGDRILFLQLVEL